MGPPGGPPMGPPPGGLPPPLQEGKKHPLAIASLMLGAVSIFPGCCCMYWGIPIPAVGFVLGLLAIRAIAKNPYTVGGRGLAIAGVTTSLLAILIDVIAIFYSVNDRLREFLPKP